MVMRKIGRDHDDSKLENYDDDYSLVDDQKKTRARNDKKKKKL